MKVSRRSLILGALTGSALLVATPYAYIKLKHGSASEIIIAILKRRVGYLDIEESVFADFSKDYLDFRSSYQNQLAKLALVATPLRFISPYNLLEMDHPLRRLEDNVVSNFLLSTNYFHADKGIRGAEIKYLGFYDTIARPCSNPFHQSA